jgi:hypothetical protein
MGPGARGRANSVRVSYPALDSSGVSDKEPPRVVSAVGGIESAEAFGATAIVQRLGPAFALLVPVQYTVETQPPESGLHPHTHDFHDVVDPGVAAILVVVIVLVIVADKVVAWVVRASD